MKILVTGANGYLGQGIVKEILDNGHKVIAVDISVDHVDERAERIACDIFALSAQENIFPNVDAVLHLAWRDGFLHYSDAHIHDLPKHFDFLCWMTKSPDLKKIAVMGSMHEVGFYEGSIHEDTPCNPITPYGISKNALRGLVQMLTQQKRLDFQWLRGFYIVGNSAYGNSIFSKISTAVSEKKKEFPFTMGQNQYDFVDYDVFCRQVAAAVTQNDINGIINICSGKPEKLADRVERFIQENGYDIHLKYGAFPDRPYDSKAIWGNDLKIKTIIEAQK